MSIMGDRPRIETPANTAWPLDGTLGPNAGPAHDPFSPPFLEEADPAGALFRMGWDPSLVADRLALGLAHARHLVTLPLAKAARRFVEGQDWLSFGYARIEDHARERFGRSGRWVRDLRSLAMAAERTPALAHAMTGEDGGRPIGPVPALAIGKVVTPASCEQWVTLARRLTVRELREEVRKAREGGSASPLMVARSQSEADRPGQGEGGITRDGELGAQGPSADGVQNAPAAKAAAGGAPEDPTAGTPADALGRVHAITSEPANTPPLDLESDESEERVTVRFGVPLPVSAAVEEARDLHRAVCGSESSVAEFVEAIVAEAFAGPTVPVIDEGWIGSRPSTAAREMALEQETDRWAFLGVPRLGDELCAAGRTLEKTARLCREAEVRSNSADSLIRALIKVENEIERSLGPLLARMGEFGAWRGMRFSGVGHYAEERLGISRTQAEDRARLARDLRERPLLRSALEEGRFGWEAASLIVKALPLKLATEEMETAWIDRASESTIKRLREELRTVDLNRALHGAKAPSAPIDDATWRASRARDPGLSIARITQLTRAAIAGPGVTTVIRFSLPPDLASHLLSAVSAERARLESICREAGVDGATGSDGDRADATREGLDLREPVVDCHTPGSVTAARMFSTRFGFVPDWVALLALIENFVTTWDDPRRSPKRPGDRIYNRDAWRCSAPGCTSRRNLEQHHIRYRSRGGSDRPSNLVTLCRSHHQQGEHNGLLRCRGRAPLGILWWLGRRGKGGFFRNERRLGIHGEWSIFAR